MPRGRGRTPTVEDLNRISVATAKLRSARRLLRLAGAHHAAEYAGRAVKSAEGAERHALRMATAPLDTPTREFLRGRQAARSARA